MIVKINCIVKKYDGYGSLVDDISSTLLNFDYVKVIAPIEWNNEKVTSWGIFLSLKEHGADTVAYNPDFIISNDEKERLEKIICVTGNSRLTIPRI